MDADVTVVGAGIVGLAIAAELASPSRTLVVVERHATFGRETSSRNSQVVHAGFFHPPGWLKSRLCVEGHSLLHELCRSDDVELRPLGKLVVATDADEEAALAALHRQGVENGVELRMLGGEEARALEPHVRATAAMLSPRSGVVCVDELMRRLLDRARARGAQVAWRTEVVGLRLEREAWRVTTRAHGDSAPHEHGSRIVVNCAGLDADRVAALAGIDVERDGLKQHWCRGDYYSVRPSRSSLVSRLVYPVPVPGAPGHGVHVTLDLDGRMRLGPDASYVDRALLPPPTPDPSKAEAFLAATRRFLPRLELDDLAPEMAGFRAKLSGPGEPPRDFVIEHEAARGLPGLVNLVGIESPGVTASLAIARHVRRLLQADGLLD